MDQNEVSSTTNVWWEVQDLRCDGKYHTSDNLHYSDELSARKALLANQNDSYWQRLAKVAVTSTREETEIEKLP